MNVGVILLEALLGGVRWYLGGLLLTMVAFPLARSWLPCLQAWTLSRLLAPFLIAWFAICPAFLVGSIPYTPFTVALSSCLIFLAGLLTLKWSKIRLRWQDEWGPIRNTEIVFFLFYGFLAIAALLNASINHTDRLRDGAVWASLWIQRVFPMDDPWLAGHQLRYYVFGYYAQMAQAYASGVAPYPSYSLAMCSILATYFIGIRLFLLIAGVGQRQAGWLAVGLALSANIQAFLNFARLLLGNGTFYYASMLDIYFLEVSSNFFVMSPFIHFASGALHSDYIAFPFLITLCCLIAIFQRRQRGVTDAAFALTAGVLGGWAFGANIWEFPVLMGIGLIYLALRYHHSTRTTFLQGAVCLLTCLFVMLPFLVLQRKISSIFEWVSMGTSLWALIRLWALFLIPVIIFLVASSKERQRRTWIIPLVGVLLSLATGWGPLFLISWMLFGWVEWFREKKREHALPYLLLALGFGAALVPEVFALKESTLQFVRFNTVIKFNTPAWILVGLGATLLGVRLYQYFPKKVYFTTLVLWLMGLSSFLPLWVGYAMARNQFASMDGLRLIEAQSSDDASLIRWMRMEIANGGLRGTLLEANGPAYSFHSRFSSATGMSNYFGFPPGHNYLHEIYSGNPEVLSRKEQIDAFFETGTSETLECESLCKMLEDKKISYVALGKLETDTLSPQGMEKIEKCLPLVKRFGKSSLLSRCE